EPVVHDREQAHAALLRLDLPCDAALVLLGERRVVERPPAVDEPARRVELERRRVAPDLAPRTAGVVALGRDRDRGAVEVAPGELGLRDRVPDLLGARLDEHLVDLRRLLRERRHRRSSSPLLSSESADTRRSVYLSIHRSWISRIGTGFRKWCFSRPDRRVTTRPASSSTRRCFITPKRVISRSLSSSESVRPSRSKSRSSRCRRVGSASALKTESSSVTSASYVTIWSHVNDGRRGRPRSTHRRDGRCGG